MKVYEAIAKAFIDEGTTTMFGMMGASNQHFINAMHKRGVNMINVRHEGPGLQMAEGWALATGRPGVLTTTRGPAVTQFATTMVVASRAHTPLVVFVGDTPRGDDLHHHRFDEAKFAEAIECGFIRVGTAGAAYNAVQKAFYFAKLESRPFMVSAPLDVQRAKFPLDDDEEYIPSGTLLTCEPLYPHPNPIKKAAEIIAKSRKPVIIAGRGAMRSGAQDAVRKLAARIGALVGTSLVAMNWPFDGCEYYVGMSGFYSSKVAIELLQDADCVIGVGASLNEHTTAHGYLFPEAKFIQIDTAGQVLIAGNRPADVYIRADARLGLEVLDQVLEQRSFVQTGWRTPEVKAKIEAPPVDPTVYDIAPGTVDPREAVKVLNESLPASFGLVIAGSHGMGFSIEGFRGKFRPFTFISKGFLGMMKGITTGIGATVATGIPTVAMDGDASVMMNIPEFDTAVRYKLPLLLCILNDEALGSELHHAKLHLDELDPELCRIPSPNFAAVAVGFGGRGHLIRSIDELRAACAEFIADPSPTLLDIRIDSQVQSIPTRRMAGVENV